MFELEMISLNYTGPQRGRTEKNNDDDNNVIAKILGNNFVLKHSTTITIFSSV